MIQVANSTILKSIRIRTIPLSSKDKKTLEKEGKPRALKFCYLQSSNKGPTTRVLYATYLAFIPEAAFKI